VANTITGLDGVPPTVKDAARGMGMRHRQVLMQIELPRPTAPIRSTKG